MCAPPLTNRRLLPRTAGVPCREASCRSTCVRTVLRMPILINACRPCFLVAQGHEPNKASYTSLVCAQRDDLQTGRPTSNIHRMHRRLRGLGVAVSPAAPVQHATKLLACQAMRRNEKFRKGTTPWPCWPAPSPRGSDVSSVTLSVSSLIPFSVTHNFKIAYDRTLASQSPSASLYASAV